MRRLGAILMMGVGACTLDSLGGTNPGTGGADTTVTSSTAAFMATTNTTTTNGAPASTTPSASSSTQTTTVDASSSTGAGCTDQVAQLDGVDDVIVHGSSTLAIPQTHTYAVGAWIKPGMVDAEMAIASGTVAVNNGASSDFRLGLKSEAGKIVAVLEVKQAGTTCLFQGVTDITTSRWTHVVGNVGDTEASILVDGVIDAVTACDVSGIGEVSALRAGSDGCEGAMCWAPYAGLIDDFAFWSTPFDPGVPTDVRFVPTPSAGGVCETAGTAVNPPAFLVDMEGMPDAQTIGDLCSGTGVGMRGAGADPGNDDPALVMDTCQPGP